MTGRRKLSRRENFMNVSPRTKTLVCNMSEKSISMSAARERTQGRGLGRDERGWEEEGGVVGTRTAGLGSEGRSWKEKGRVGREGQGCWDEKGRG